MTEIFKLYTLFCDIGKTQASVLVPAGEEVHDNTISHTVSSCGGCSQWSELKLGKVEAEIKAETLQQFGTDAESYTGIYDGRVNQLSQLLVDQAQFIRGTEHKIVVAMCTPIGAE